MAKYRAVLEVTGNVTPENRELQTDNHSVVTYEQTKNRSSFDPKIIVEADGVHTLLLVI